MGLQNLWHVVIIKESARWSHMSLIYHTLWYFTLKPFLILVALPWLLFYQPLFQLGSISIEPVSSISLHHSVWFLLFLKQFPIFISFLDERFERTSLFILLSLFQVLNLKVHRSLLKSLYLIWFISSSAFMMLWLEKLLHLLFMYVLPYYLSGEHSMPMFLILLIELSVQLSYSSQPWMNHYLNVVAL